MNHFDLLLPRSTDGSGPVFRWGTLEAGRVRLDGDAEALPEGVDSLLPLSALRDGERLFVVVADRRAVVLGARQV
ncbi:hypothetical protein ACUH96_00960 [Dermabacteraceae bacterium P13077]